MLSNSHFKKIVFCFVCLLLLAGCAPLVPDNYLSPTTIKTSQKIEGDWKKPVIIPISVNMLNTAEGQKLLKPALRPQPYQIGPYDSLDIIVWGHPDVSTISTNFSLPDHVKEASGATANNNNPTIVVQSNGTIFYPYVGTLKVEGLTIEDVQKKITQRLSRYIRSPQVTVRVAKYRNRNVYILGEVKTPGMQPITDKPLTLMEALSGAGGINTSTADPSHIYLVRGSYKKPIIFWLNGQSPQALLIAEQFPLKENDILYVSAATFNSWNNFINTILPSFNSYYIMRGLSNA